MATVPSTVAVLPPGRFGSSMAVLLAAALASCGSPNRAATPVASGVEPSRSAPVAPSGAASASPASEPSGPASGWRATILGDRPLINGPDVEGVVHLLAGAVVADGGIIHAWVVGFGESIGDQSLLELSWPADAGVVATIDEPAIDTGLDLADPGPIPTSVARMPDGSFAMFGWGTTSAQRSEPVLWRATAATPAGPWVPGPGTVLEPRDPPAWDSGRLDFPTVLLNASGTQLMVYEGASVADPDASQIGVAESEDGIAWTRHDTPVIAPGHCGSGDGVSVFMPRAVALERELLVAYLGTDGSTTGGAIYLSSAETPTSWTCQDPAPVLVGDSFAGSGGIHSFAAYQVDGVVHLVVEVLGDDFATSALWLVRLDPPAS